MLEERPPGFKGEWAKVNISLTKVSKPPPPEACNGWWNWGHFSVIAGGEAPSMKFSGEVILLIKKTTQCRTIARAYCPLPPSSCQRPVIPLPPGISDPQLTCNKYQPKPNDKVISEQNTPKSSTFISLPTSALPTGPGWSRKWIKSAERVKTVKAPGFTPWKTQKYPEDHVLYKTKKASKTAYPYSFQGK